MSKRTTETSSVADQIAVFIGKSMGELMNKKSALQSQLAEVEKQIEGVRASVMKQFGGTAKAKRRAKGALKRAGKAVRRELSPATRRKMAAAARRRWARVRKAAKEAAGA
ncbi:MAG: hypothetical protein AB7U83_23040 [Vicinamibacterales bacterium]